MELDTYRLSKLASYTSATFGNRVVESISANTIISKFNDAFKWMADAKVPESDQIIYVNPTVMQQIRNTTELYKRLSQSEYKGDVSFSIEKYEGRQIVEVPSDEFYTECNLLQNVSLTGLPADKGAIAPTSASKLINFMVVDRKAPIVVNKVAMAKVYNSVDGNGAYLGFAGYLLTNLLYHDIFVPDNKRPCIYASVSTTDANTSANALLLDIVADSTANKSIVKFAQTNPNGIIFDSLYFKASATKIAIGTAIAGQSATQIYLDTAFTSDASHNVFYAVYDGKVVAVSQDFTAIPRGQ